MTTILHGILIASLLLLGGQYTPSGPPGPHAPGATGLLDGWPMNEGSGTTFFDIAATSPTDVGVSLSNGSWGAVTGFPATPFTFGGSNGAINNSSGNYSLLGNVPFSSCAWIRASSFPSGEAGIIGTLNPSSGFIGWELEALNGHIRFNLVAAVSGNNLLQVDQVASLATSTTEQVCSTYSGNMNTSGITLYYAGTSTAFTVSQNNLSSSATSSGTLGIGIRNGGGFATTNPFPGTIGYVSVWSCALSPTVIANNAAAGPSFTGLHC